MKAIYLVRNGEAREAFETREAPTPQPGAGEIRIAVEAFGLNYADVSARRGLYRDAPPIPCVVGYEVVGRVDALGANVREPEVGRRVVALTRFGGYATHAVTDARAAVPIPDDMDTGIAVAIPTQGCTAYYMAEEMVRLHAGDHVLVQAAAGGVGTLLVQLCKRRGCIVYGTAGSEDKIDLLRRHGRRSSDQLPPRGFCRRGAHGCAAPPGLDVIFDSLGGSAVRKGIGLLGAGGRIVCYGAASHESGSLQILRTVKFAASFGFPHPIPLLLGSKSIIGVNMLRIADNRPEVLQRCLRAVVELVAGRRSPADRRRALSRRRRSPTAHEFLESRGSTGKIVVDWA